ncbi:MAG: hypothetical protein QXJ02_06600, partial [Candidatus Bathyarchaeia archaeon]
SVIINPPLAIITIGQSVNYTSIVNGGIPPYSYAWYVNGTYVGSGTTLLYTPPFVGTYYVYLNVTDHTGTTAQSNIAKIIVNAPAPVGGYSIGVNTSTALRATAYLALVFLLGAMLSLAKRKRK